jgi:hypothetical protein
MFDLSPAPSLEGKGQFRSGGVPQTPGRKNPAPLFLLREVGSKEIRERVRVRSCIKIPHEKN